ncbi:MAG: hypothetical protein ACTHJ0_08730, partial [Flavipsychrobacter sp.]
VSDEQTTIDLPPGSTQIIPLTVARQPGALASWTPVNITAQLKNSPIKDQYQFFVRDKVNTNFGIYPLSQYIQVTENQKFYEVKLLIKNKGNLEQHYCIVLENSLFELNDKYYLTLPPHFDSTVSYSFHIKKEMWARLKKEDVRVRVINDSNRENYYSYTVDKIGSVAKQNAQAYETIPISLEGGLMQFNNTIAYYGAITGDIAFNKETNLGFYYRSREFGITGVQYNVFNIFFNYKKWQISAGQMIGPKDFYTIGNGLRLSYTDNEGISFAVYGIKHQPGLGTFNDIYGVNFGYHLTHEIVLKHCVAASYDTSRNMNSYILTNEAQLIKNKTTSLNINGGVGFDHPQVPIPGVKDTLGTSVGYNFTFSKDKLRVISSVQLNSSNYPGMFRGYKYQNHDIRYQETNSFIGLYYRYNYLKTNYFKDSIYNLTSYNYNLSNYGVQAGWNNKLMSIVVGTGVLTQTDQTTAPPKYISYSLDYSLAVTKFLFFQSSSLLGFPTFSFSKSPDLYTQLFSLGSSYGGFQMLYSRFPNYQSSFTPTGVQTTGDQKGFIETANYGAYVNGKFFHNKLCTRLSYFLTETLSDHTSVSNANADIRYENKHIGLTVSLNGNMPLQKENLNNHYASLSVIKDLNVPIVFKRKYFDLKLTVFNDENSNGKYDNNEPILKNVQVTINNYGMLTDEKGSILYKNVEKGNYVLDFHSIKGVKGLIPANGFTQSVIVNGKTDMQIPFKKARIITGHLNVEVDTISHTPVPVLNYRVTATDSSGEKYTDLTDAQGNFTLSLPAGKYSVALNPAAFADEAVKPTEISYNVDLVNNEEGIVIFKLVQKKRGVVFIKADL